MDLIFRSFFLLLFDLYTFFFQEECNFELVMIIDGALI